MRQQGGSEHCPEVLKVTQATTCITALGSKHDALHPWERLRSMDHPFFFSTGIFWTNWEIYLETGWRMTALSLIISIIQPQACQERKPSSHSLTIWFSAALRSSIHSGVPYCQNLAPNSASVSDWPFGHVCCWEGLGPQEVAVKYSYRPHSFMEIKGLNDKFLLNHA